ncbi:MAG: hypothetical protein IKN74_01615 [Clostridia bacterium]|nr:hypothetical protein [Clostridia bacterium]
MAGSSKTSAPTLLALIVIIALIVVCTILGVIIYDLKTEQVAVKEDNEIVNTESKVEQNNNSDELITIKDINNSSMDYEDHAAKNDNDVLYNFKTHKWSNVSFDLFYLAIDSNKNLYIVDAAETVVAKLDAKLEKLEDNEYTTEDGQVIKFAIDNYILNARVSKLRNVLEIQTANEFQTFLVDLDDYSTKLAEINDD